ncbi:MAG: hypothetical protein P1V35_01995 [Planctomycetota bacterium]|nr:hypothetical protein [Planctomycetota bacterium]
MIPENLEWRGSKVPCLALPDAFKLHLAMGFKAEGTAGKEDLDSQELRHRLERRDLELAQARGELKRMQSRVEQRDLELKTLMESVGELERAVVQQANVHRDLANVQTLYVEAQAQKSELVLKLSQSKQAHRELRQALQQTHDKFEAMQARLESARATVRTAEASLERIEGNATQATEQLTRELSAAHLRAAQAEAAALAAQTDPEELKRRSQARQRTARRLRLSRATCRTASAVERNLERYCNRLERQLRGES